MNDRFVEWWISHPSLFGMPFHFWTLIVGILGSFVGSFLNVCIHRMPLGMSVVTPPSHCPKCSYQIPWYLNIPVVTWLWLRGRCRSCKAPISPRYLGVELLTAAAFVLCWLRFGHDDPATALALCALLASFIVATFIDFEHFIIPDEITIGGTVAGVLLTLAAPGLHHTFSRATALRSSLLGAAIGFGVVYGVVRLGKLLFGREKVAIEPGTRVVFHEEGIRLPDREIPFGDVFYRDSDAVKLVGKRIELADRCYPEARVQLTQKALVIGNDTFAPETEPYLAADTSELVLPREAMGFGDVKFMAAIGAFLGWQSTLFTLAIASLMGAFVGIGLILIGRREWSSRLPFGPYLAAGAIVWVFGGWRWWWMWFGPQ